jgi:phosphatidylglycerol---prolipoprotein diacylglyceryl transferase
MHPELFSFPDFIPLIGGRAIHVYGLMIALAFLFGMYWTKREARRLGINEKNILDLFFYTLIAGLVGARILYVIQSVDNFWQDPLILIRVWEGGLVFQGGVIGSFIVAIWYCRRHEMRFMQNADVFAPALSFGHALGRIGCFFAGCCYGKQCAVDFPLAIVFPQIAGGIAPAGVPLYPTQLLESFGEILIFTFLVSYRKRKKFDGAVILLYLILYSVLRSFLEVFRGDGIRGFVIEPYLSNAQFISLIMVIVSMVFWFYLKKKEQV